MQSSNDHNRRWRTRAALALLSGLVITVVTLVSPSPTVFAGDGDLTLTKTVEGGATSVSSGQPITYRLTYSCVANGSPPPITCERATLVDTIPTFVDIDGVTQRLEYFSSQGSIDTTDDGVYDAAAGTVTFTFDQDFDAGSSGFVRVTLRPPFHTVPDGTLVHNTSTLALNGQQTTSSADVTVIAETVLTTAKSGPLSAGVGTDVSYNISACAESGLGRLPADDVIIVDTIPAGAIVVSTTPAASIAGNTVQWNIGRVEPGIPTSCRGVGIVLRYPNGPFSGGQVVVNNVTTSGREAGSQTLPPPVSASAATTLIAGDRIVSFKSASVLAATTGDPITWRLGFESNGSDPLSSVVLTDTIPPEVRVTALNTGANTSATPVTVEFSADGGATYTVITGSPFPGGVNQRIDVAPLLAPGQFVTNVRYSWGATPSFWNVYPTIESVVINPDRNGNAYGGKIVTNCLDSRYSSPTAPNGVGPRSCADVSVSSEPSPSIGLALPLTATRASTVDAVVFVENYAPATSGLVQPVVSLVVPEGFAFVPGSTAWDPVATGMPAPDIVEVVPNWDGGPDSLVRWRWSAPVTFPRGLGALIRLQLSVDVLASAGTRTFRTTISNQAGQPGFSACNSSRANNYVTSDPFDRDGDGATTDQLCEALTTADITAAAGLDSYKEVQGELDTTFSAVGNTTPGGRANYRLTVENNGTQAIDPGATFIDTLPEVGDTLVTSTVPRGSQWSPYLVDEIQGTTATVEYSTATNPCRGEVSGPTVGCTPPNWTTWNATLAANPTVIRSLKFTFPAGLDPGAVHTFTWEMRVPLDLSLISKRAYNSFAYHAQPSLGGPPLRSEPPKVELLIAANPGGGLIGDYTWNDLDRDGTQGVNEPPIQGTLVELWSVGPDGLRGTPDDTQVSFTRTDAQGLYLFQNVPPNARYYIRFVGIPDTIITTQDAGGDDNFDSDAEPGTGPTAGWTDAFDFCIASVNCDDRTHDAGFVSALGSFTIAKNVTGPGKALTTTADFIVRYTCNNGATDDITIRDNEQEPISGIPAGTICDFEELTRPTIPGVAFGTPIISPATLTIAPGASTTITVTNPTTLTPGGFRVLKSVTGPAASLVPNTTGFPFTYNCGAGVTGNGSVTPNTPADITGIPAGSTCTVTEGTRPTITGVTFGTPTVTPATITIPPGGTPTSTTITITNPTTLTPGGFMVTKVLNDPNSLVPGGTGYRIDYLCSNGTIGNTTISPGSPAVVSGLPAGTTCDITETLPQIGTIAWGTAVISPGTVTIPAGATAPATVTNTAGAANGSFTIAKNVTGPGKALTTTADFIVRYTCNNGATDDITIRDNEQEPISGIPAGTICDFEELTRPTIPGVAFGTPIISPATLTIAPGASTTITVTNPTTLTPGGFMVTKVLNDPNSLVPGGTGYRIDYLCSNGTIGNTTISPGSPAVVSGLPAGTTCDITETLPQIGTIAWGTAVISPGTVTIPAGATAPATVTNTAGAANGSFTIAKNVTGPGKALTTTADFIVRYTCNNGATDDITIRDNEQEPISGIPAGTICDFEELTRPTIPGVAFGTPIISPATLTIAPGASTTITVTNPTTLTPGGFRVLKSVTGPAASLVPNTTGFPFTYNCGAGVTGNGSVTPNTPADITGIPAGSTCTVTEGTRPTITGVTFGTPTVTPATITIPPGGTPTSTTITITNPTTLTPGGFRVLKSVTGPAASLVPNTTGFPFTYNCGAGVTGNGSVTPNTPADITGIPAGSTCTVTEGTRPTITGVTFGTPTVTPATITIPPGGTPTSTTITITNPTTLTPGGFMVTKSVTGLAAASVPPTTEYAVEYNCGPGFVDRLILTINSPAVSPNIPAGATCTLSETPPTNIPGVSFGSAVFSPPSPIVISAGTTVTVDLTNIAGPSAGDFTITKIVAGTAQSAIPARTTYAIHYDCGNGNVGDFDLTDRQAVPVDNIPAGSTCTVTERTPSQIAGITYGTAVITPSTFTVLGGGTSSITVTVTNPANLNPGRLEITKSVTGPAASLVPNGTAFKVDYTCGAVTGTVDVVFGSPTPATVPNISAGTTCDVSEQPPTSIPGVDFGTASFSPSASILIPGGATQAVSVLLTNPTTLADGSFTIAKSVTGAAASLVPAGTVFTVDYNCGSGVVGAVDVALGAATPMTVANIPAGSSCALTERTPAAITGVVFGQSIFTPASPIIVAGGAQVPVDVLLENPTSLAAGEFTITKILSGAAASSVATAALFTINWTCTGGITGTVALPVGSTHTVGQIPAGSDCTIDETAPATLQGITWATPTITPTTFRIDGGTAAAIAVTVENIAEVSEGGFSVTKSLTGTGVDAVPAATEFEVRWTCDDGTSGTFLLSRGTTTLVAGVRAGSTCTLTESSPPAIDGVRWEAPTFSPAATLTVAGGNNPTVAIDLVNTATSLPGGFTVTKRVTGGGEAAIDSSWKFVVFYACSDGANGSLSLQRDTPVTVSGRPAGTTCRLSEASPELRDGLEWGAPVYSPAAEFIIVADRMLDITLTNPVERSKSVPATPTRPGAPNTPPNPNRPIPVTGTDVQGWLAIGLALVMLGVGILIITRRRISQDVHS